MTNDDIIRMARQVEAEGFAFPLVMPEIRRLCELARADEREECAKLCDSSINDTYIVGETGAKHYARRECAAAIRARGNK